MMEIDAAGDVLWFDSNGKLREVYFTPKPFGLLRAWYDEKSACILYQNHRSEYGTYEGPVDVVG